MLDDQTTPWMFRTTTCSRGNGDDGVVVLILIVARRLRVPPFQGTAMAYDVSDVKTDALRKGTSVVGGGCEGCHNWQQWSGSATSRDV